MNLLWGQPEKKKKSPFPLKHLIHLVSLSSSVTRLSLFVGLTLRLIHTNPIVLLSTQEEVCEGRKKKKEDEQELFDKAGSIVLSWFGTIRLSVSKEPSDNKALLEKIFFSPC